jgi:uncharacterized protein
MVIAGLPIDFERLRTVCERYGVARLEVFGSVGRGNAVPDSDIDLLYDLRPGARLGWDVEALAEELEAVLGRRVDLVSRAALHDRIRDALLAEMLEVAEQAQNLVAGTDVEALAADRQRRGCAAVEPHRAGRGSRSLDDSVTARFPAVEWARPSQLRNRIVHGYWSIDLAILHTTATDQLPGFVRQLREVLAELEADDP